MGRLTNGTLLAVAFLSLIPAQAQAETAGLRVYCNRLSLSEQEELAARVHLLFAERKLEPRKIELRCTRTRAWVQWEDETIFVPPDGSLSESFIDVVDARLAVIHRRPAATDERKEPSLGIKSGDGAERTWAKPGPNSELSSLKRPLTFSSSTPSPAELPVFDRPKELPPASQRWPELYRPEGGLSLGLDADSRHGSLEASWGPRLEVGLPVGMFTLLGAETARFGSDGERTTMNLGAELGVGFGAPYARGALLGLALRGYSDWLIGYTRDATIARTFWSPGLALGLRAALNAPFVPWIGIDGRWRLSRLKLTYNDAPPLPQLTAMLTIGLAYLADSPRPFSTGSSSGGAPAPAAPHHWEVAQASEGAILP